MSACSSGSSPPPLSSHQVGHHLVEAGRLAEQRLDLLAAASAGRISWRVRMRRSSIANTLVGSAIATTRRPSPSTPHGHGLVAARGLLVDQPRDGRVNPVGQGEEGRRPSAVAIARASWSRVIFSSRHEHLAEAPAPVRFWRSRASASSCSVSRPIRTSTWPERLGARQPRGRRAQRRRPGHDGGLRRRRGRGRAAHGAAGGAPRRAGRPGALPAAGRRGAVESETGARHVLDGRRLPSGSVPRRNRLRGLREAG